MVAVGEAELAHDGALLSGDEPPEDLPLDQRLRAPPTSRGRSSRRSSRTTASTSAFGRGR
ncbi:hypothetical protein [Streptosporangium vulgare]|uniref:hypothetical protein n=1 Tax=Streptosporangium vulgare TaxID=46190 RepID=UPI0031D1D90B